MSENGAEHSERDEHVLGLVEFAKALDLEELEWEKDGRRVAFKRKVNGHANGVSAPAPASASPAPVSPVPAAAPAAHIVTSPMVGTFWRAVSKDRPPLVVEGGAVTAGQRLAVVEAMKIPKDVVCDANGRITKIFIENGKPVEYGQKLFEIETEPSA